MEISRIKVEEREEKKNQAKIQK